MMTGLADKSRSVDGVPTSLIELGYDRIGMDDVSPHRSADTPQLDIQSRSWFFERLRVVAELAGLRRWRERQLSRCQRRAAV